jgi:predicted nuclease of predicted toxin-antitoxin system
VSRPRFLADHDLNEHIITGVVRRQAGIAFRRARDLGLQDRPDPEVLAYAAEQGLLVVSHDVNTMPAHAHRRLAAGLPLAGLLLVRQTDPVAEVIDSLVLIWSSSEAEEWQGHVVYLPL